MSKKMQLLYLLQSGDLYKIGISNDINNRIKSLQTGSGYEVKCIAYYKTKEPARTVENKLHKLFDKYRKKGEWFDFEGRFTLELFETLCDRYGMQRLEFEQDGTCKIIYEEQPTKKLRAFGDIPNHPEVGNKHNQDSRGVEYWRKYYGIKTKRK